MKKSVLSAMVVVLLLGLSGYASFFIAPTDAKQGLIYRILFLHVASAWTGLTSFFICFIANLLYVLRRQPRWDWLGVSAGETGLVFTTVVLLTGPIWAHPVWGIWWTWDARLTSTFVLWLLYVSFLLLRTLIGEADRRAVASAVFGVFAFLDVPLVYMSIRWWRTQHPQPVLFGGPGSGLDPQMRVVFYTCWVALAALMALVMRQRFRVESLRHEVEELRIQVEGR